MDFKNKGKLIPKEFKINYLSFIPNKVFNYYLSPPVRVFDNLKQRPILLKKQKYKKKLITTLRSPKHFKIGRNHFPVYRKNICTRFTLNKYRPPLEVTLDSMLVFFKKKIIVPVSTLPTCLLFKAHSFKLTITFTGVFPPL